MALTFRTGSGGKGSALTIDELDNNFRYFTGSHSVTGSFEVSGSIILTGSLNIDGTISDISTTNLTASSNISASGDLEVRNITASSNISASGDITAQTGSFGSIIPSDENATLGNESNPWKELFVSDGSIVFVSGSVTSSFSVDSSGSLSGSVLEATSASFATTASSATSASFAATASEAVSASFADDTPFNSGSCLIGCTTSLAPSEPAREGTFKFLRTGPNYAIYVYLNGGWRSGSLS